MQKKIKRENGEVVVEATIILPIAILCVILLLYISVFICQKAMLQAALETSVIYFKNTLTDSFVEQRDELSYESKEDGVSAIGNEYTTPEPLNPYEKFFLFHNKVSKEEFIKYFQSVAGNLLYEDCLDLDIHYSNYILFKEVEVTAEQVVTFPIDFSMIGVGREVNLSATARVAVADHDELIRNIDFAVDALEDTKLGEVVKNLASKVTGLYNKLKSL